MKNVNRLLSIVLVGLVVAGAVGCRSKDETDDITPSPQATTRAGGESTPAAAASPAPTAAPSVAVPATGVSHGTLEIGGLKRTYRLYVPKSMTNATAVPLLVALHGGLGWGDQFANTSRFEVLAATEGFVVVYPDGEDRTWNAGGCCGQAARKNVDDVGFLAALIDELSRQLPIDSGRVFMTGHSNGAMMSFRFGCERPEMVKAIAPVAGSLETPTCKGATGTNLLAIHGDSDQNHPIEGGEGPRSIAGVPFVSMEKSLALWTAAMGCEATPEHSTAGAIRSTVWTKCKDGTKASYLIVAGADHPWPGGPSGAQGTAASDAIDATTAVWAFFKTLK